MAQAINATNTNISTISSYDSDIAVSLVASTIDTADTVDVYTITPTQRNSQTVVLIQNTTGVLQWVVSPGGAWSAQGKTKASSTDSSISGTTLTVAGTITGTFQVGQYIIGAGVTAGTRITALGTGTGGAGTYIVSASQTVTSKAIYAGSLSGTTAATTTDAIVLDTSKYLSSTGTLEITFAPASGTKLQSSHVLKVAFVQLP
jgi:hypothetical protein